MSLPLLSLHLHCGGVLHGRPQAKHRVPHRFTGAPHLIPLVPCAPGCVPESPLALVALYGLQAPAVMVHVRLLLQPGPCIFALVRAPLWWLFFFLVCLPAVPSLGPLPACVWLLCSSLPACVHFPAVIIPLEKA